MTKAKEESEEQREARLIKARKQATKAREEKMVEKYKDKVLAKVGGRPKRDDDEASASRPARKEESESDEDDEAPKKPISTAITKPPKEPKPIKEEVAEEVAEEEKPKAKPKAKKAKAKVIIEQDSSDDEVFEASKDVIFVKRVRAKAKAEALPPQVPQHAQPPPVTRQEQPLPERYQVGTPPHGDFGATFPKGGQPQKAVMTPEKRLEMERYLNMTRGNFLPMSRPR